ncbi:leucine-rich repeat flightless-interacting protein 2 isoform X15 [Malurus melanocephalus]|uniref:leucine-rich repeat flightless-interacting protein 2 isoform X15 n=1 Tax=Malurus melanocephalus TaxID=175006 RepID=UPI0025476CA0|nr:leucine-rich repeat flightless-interacting protein 2 isoform X15 [Malurus melanocephalus]
MREKGRCAEIAGSLFAHDFCWRCGHSRFACACSLICAVLCPNACASEDVPKQAHIHAVKIQRIKMGTPGSGRKRTPVKDRFSAEDEALSNIAREAEARLAAKRAARAEARDIRMRELERQQKELEEKSEKSHSEIFSRPSSRNSVTLSGNSSRRGSGDASSLVDPDASLSELRDSLAEVEEKYKKAMVSNAQLDNEKNNLVYQVDTLKDIIEEKEEQIAEFYRENEEKSKELERQKHTCSVLQHKLDELKEGLRQRDELIEKHGLVIIPDGTPNGDVNHESVVGAITVVSQEAAQVLESAGEGPLDIRLQKLAGEKEELLSQVRKLKIQLEEERQKYSKSDIMNPDFIGLENGADLQLIEMQRDANRQISEYKFKLSKAEQDITTLEQNIGRLEGQVARYKNAAENAEKVEDELKAEKRKLQRELRTALDKIEEMEMTNSHLMKRLEKMKANRTALLSQQ